MAGDRLGVGGKLVFRYRYFERSWFGRLRDSNCGFPSLPPPTLTNEGVMTKSLSQLIIL